MDDFCPYKGFRGEHGLSLHIEQGSTRLLFDTGQSAAFMANAETLGMPLDRLDAVVLSHGHYDHGGGLPALFADGRAAPSRFYAGRGFGDFRWAAEGGTLRDIGLAGPALSDLHKRATLVDTTLEIAEGLYLLPCAEMRSDARIDPRFRAGAPAEIGSEGALGGAGPLGSTGAPGPGVLPETTRPDLFEDELSLVSVDNGALTIITGCAHRGILNIVEAARRAFPGKPVRAIVGGFHLGSWPDSALARIASDLAALGPAGLYPSHCTGLRGFAALDAALHGKVTWLSCGMTIEP